MPDTLFGFVKQVASLAQKLTDAALMELSDPAGNGSAPENLLRNSIQNLVIE